MSLQSNAHIYTITLMLCKKYAATSDACKLNDSFPEGKAESKCCITTQSTPVRRMMTQTAIVKKRYFVTYAATNDKTAQCAE